MAPGAGSTRDKDYRAARARCDGAIKCRRQFKPPCGAACGQVELLGLELLGLELLGPRHHPTAAARSRPISRSIGWLRAYDKGIAPRCNNASTARCNRARKNMRSDVRRAGAISERPRRVHARGAVPTWMSQRSLQRVIVSSAARISNDRLLAGIGCARIARPESLAIIILLRRAGAERPGPRGDFAWRGQREQMPSAKKLTRPDGEIRAGRVDRRRGSGGRERRSGL